MNKQLLRYLQLILLVLDILILNMIVMFSKSIFSTIIPDVYAAQYFHLLIFLNTSWLLLSWIGLLYNERFIFSFEVFSKRTFSIYFTWMGSVMIYLFFYGRFQLSQLFVVALLLFFGGGLLLNRFIYLGLRIFYKDQKHFLKRIVILGYNDVAKKIASYLENSTSNTKIVGFIEDSAKVKELTHYPILSSVENALETSKKLSIDEIYSTITPEQNKSIYVLMQQAESECIRFKIIPDLSLFIQNPIHIEYLNDIPILSLRREPLEDVGNRIKKRVFDVLVSSFAIIFILSWLIPILSLLIYLESPGPVFFSQLRTGKNKKAFRCIKFRSMRINHDADKKQATKNDNRFTKIGKLIRKTSLDEFPQFINVFKGEMSLVGPRPHMLRHTEDYSKIVNNYMVRHLLKPGITGWAQVNGYRGEINGNEQILGRVECDIWYSENWSLWLDMRVVFLTVYNMFKGEQNAY